jgi:DNA-binding SARP family transcriptional activator/tetratricopeptide (TPR) repeat protein
MTEFRLLGPVEIRAAGRPLDLGAAKLRVVLAALIVDAGRPVTLDVLIDRVWDETPPPAARSVVHAHLSRIRGLLARAAGSGGEPPRLERRAGGYLLRASSELVDVHRFRLLVERSRNAGLETDQRAVLLAEAVDLWRGTALDGLPGEWARRVRSGLERQRLDALVQWADAELNRGRHVDVINRLSEPAAQHPLVEPLIAHLMRALYLDGRSAEALDLHARTRRLLIDELGTEPGREIRDVHQAILREDPVDLLPMPDGIGPQRLPAPALLPLDVRGFTGRSAALADLDAILAATDEQPTAVVVSALAGPAGVGKTALAVHWAHRVADKFPDGQLYVNLRGFDPSGAAMTPAEAVRGFLDALGVPPPRIPHGLPAQIGLYRSMLTGKRMLMVLDNARDADQIRPLLPGAPGCLVVVTSRNHLPSLVSIEGAHPLTLDLLPVGEARQLLTRRLSTDRVAAEPRAVDDIITSCARLPLALAIVAARAATQPGRSLEALADELREERGRLDAFAGGEVIIDVRAVFSWSYRTLSPAAARLFRLLALHPGPDVAAPAAASLTGFPIERTWPLPNELILANVINEPSTGRYACHDLLRAYATELAHALEPVAQRHAAVHRVLDHYLHTAYAADRLLYPNRDPIDLTPPIPGVSPECVISPRQALAWFTAEHQVLLGAVEHAAAEDRFDAHVTRLAWALKTFLDRQGHWHDWATTQTAALNAAQRLDDRQGQARTCLDLAQVCTRLGRHDDAQAHLRRALDLFAELGDDAGQAHTHRAFGWTLGLQGRHHEALNHGREALRLFRSTGHRTGQAAALNAIGWYRIQLGDHRRALTYCQRALELFRVAGHVAGQAGTLDSLGYAHHHLGDHSKAIACYQLAIDLYRELGDRYHEADTLTHLGDSHDAAGRRGDAVRTWRRALAILEELDHVDADQVRAKLDPAPAPPAARRSGLPARSPVGCPRGLRSDGRPGR